MFKFLIRFFGRIMDWLKEARNVVTVVILGIMFILFATLSIILLVQREEILATTPQVFYNISLIWNIAVSGISAFSILLLYQMPRFENANCTYHRRYKYASFTYEIVYNWYFKTMLGVGLIFGFTHSLLFGILSRFDCTKDLDTLLSEFSEFGLFIFILWLIPTIVWTILNFINYRSFVPLARSLLMILLGLGFVAMGWFAATIITWIIAIYIFIIVMRLFFIIVLSALDSATSRDYEIQELTNEIRRLRQGW